MVAVLLPMAAEVTEVATAVVMGTPQDLAASLRGGNSVQHLSLASPLAQPIHDKFFLRRTRPAARLLRQKFNEFPNFLAQAVFPYYSFLSVLSIICSNPAPSDWFSYAE